ncbi:MAG TPA: hypothetical protein VNF73_00775 [Candidatus Saccharimonadales bacterium]|nr:hypothetical protein [Candidatus Saccharimonadales bacterium]
MTIDQAVLRPQGFGRRNAKSIRDPLIEPLWRGERIMVRLVGDRAELFDADGDAVEDPPAEIVEALVAAAQADELVVDGYLTRQAIPDNPGMLLVGSELPTVGQMASQIFVGRGLRARPMVPIEKTPEPEGTLAFMAIDLLSLEGEILLDIPLLERKRLLESVLAEGELVRRTAYVRAPIDAWLASWRSIGFRELAYKGANGRYRPGGVGEDWAIALIPTT